MRLIIIILIAFACGIVKNTKGTELINVITVHFSGESLQTDIQPCSMTSEGWNQSPTNSWRIDAPRNLRKVSKGNFREGSES